MSGNNNVTKATNGSGGKVLHRVITLTTANHGDNNLAGKTTAAKPAYVPEKLHFAAYEKFEGESRGVDKRSASTLVESTALIEERQVFAFMTAASPEKLQLKVGEATCASVIRYRLAIKLKILGSELRMVGWKLQMFGEKFLRCRSLKIS